MKTSQKIANQVHAKFHSASNLRAYPMESMDNMDRMEGFL